MIPISKYVKNIARAFILFAFISLVNGSNINPYGFQVKDLHTGRPIANALVSIIFGDDLPGDCGFPEWNGKVVSGYTNDNGRVTLKLLDFGAHHQFDISPSVHFIPSWRAVGYILQGRPLIKAVECRAKGYKTIIVQDGEVEKRKYIGGAGAGPTEREKKWGWGFLSIGAGGGGGACGGITFWLAKEKTFGFPSVEGKNIPVPYFVHLYNIDDSVTCWINGEIIATANYGDTKKIDITSRLHEGDNNVRFKLVNIGGGYTWGFRIYKGQTVIWQDEAGTVGIKGANNNDQTTGIVYDRTVSITVKAKLQ